MSMSLCAALAARRAPATTAKGLPTNVNTVLLVLSPGSTSNRVQPSPSLMAEAMASITSALRPSEKLGTHSTTLSGEALSELDDDMAEQWEACTERRKDRSSCTWRKCFQ